MRIRQIKPEWWRDKALMLYARADVREFYIGLWMTADDAGWFEWDVTAIAAEIYPFVGVAKRERDIARFADILELLEPEHPHLIRHRCGHAEVPKMPQHQRISREKRVTTILVRHQIGCKQASPLPPAGISGTPQVPVPVEGRELVRDGKNLRARDDEKETTGSLPFTFEEAVPSRRSA